MILPGKEEPVITPEAFVEVEKFGIPCDGCLLVFWPKPLEYAKAVLTDVKDIGNLGGPIIRGISGKYMDKRVCVCQIYFGAPAAVAAFEVLIAVGIKRFILFGGCGAIHPSVKIYDLVIPTWGVREEGTSYHYLPPEVIPKLNDNVVYILQEKLSSITKRLNIRLHVGGIWSTDAIFRETRDKVSKKGVLCVDMESTGLMSVAIYRNVKLGIVNIVTDELYGNNWVMYDDENKKRNHRKRSCKSIN